MTYSIAARCPRTGAFGIAITSSSICVPSRCSWVSPTGAVLTQNITDPALGPLGLSLVAKGMNAKDVIKEMVAATPHSARRRPTHMPTTRSTAPGPG